ncbi:hypothetical protein APUTEX25_005585, partial [Auxenochlorella protothecoides]
GGSAGRPGRARPCRPGVARDGGAGGRSGVGGERGGGRGGGLALRRRRRRGCRARGGCRLWRLCPLGSCGAAGRAVPRAVAAVRRPRHRPGGRARGVPRQPPLPRVRARRAALCGSGPRLAPAPPAPGLAGGAVPRAALPLCLAGRGHGGRARRPGDRAAGPAAGAAAGGGGGDGLAPRQAMLVVVGRLAAPRRAGMHADVQPGGQPRRGRPRPLLGRGPRRPERQVGRAPPGGADRHAPRHRPGPPRPAGRRAVHAAVRRAGRTGPSQRGAG